MKKLALILTALLMVALLAVPAMAAGEAGMSFTADKLYPLAKDLEKAPLTFEAVVRIPVGYADRAGLILSSYDANGKDAITLQFNSGKQLELYYELNSDSFKSVRHKFTDIPVTALATGEWVHITVVKDDAAGKAHAYINGAFVQTADAATQEYGYFTSGEDPLAICIGGDHRKDNGQYFKAEIREIALFSDVRTADEIKADAKELKADKDMLVWLQLEKGMTGAKDLSGNGNHMGDYTEPVTEAVTSAPAAPAAPATPSAPQTFDAAVLLAVTAAAAGAGMVVSKKRR